MLFVLSRPLASLSSLGSVATLQDLYGCGSFACTNKSIHTDRDMKHGLAHLLLLSCLPRMTHEGKHLFAVNATTDDCTELMACVPPDFKTRKLSKSTFHRKDNGTCSITHTYVIIYRITSQTVWVCIQCSLGLLNDCTALNLKWPQTSVTVTSHSSTTVAGNSISFNKMNRKASWQAMCHYWLHHGGIREECTHCLEEWVTSLLATGAACDASGDAWLSVYDSQGPPSQKCWLKRSRWDKDDFTSPLQIDRGREEEGGGMTG